MWHKNKFLLLSICLLLQLTTKAQIENFEEDSTYIRTADASNLQILKLKKSYVLGDGITFQSGYRKINFTQSLQTSFAANSFNKNLSGFNSAFDINRARLTIIGNPIDNKISLVARLNFSSNLQSVTTGNRSFNTPLQEAYIEYRPNRKHVFNFGLRADYIDSRETRTEGENLAFINRSALSGSFDAIFDYGFRYKGTYKLGGRHLLKPYASITTGDSRSGLQKNFGGFKYGVRIDYLPFDKFSKGGEFYMEDLAREEKPKLVIGGIFSYNDGATSALGTNGGRFQYGDVNQNILLPKFTKMGVDYLFKYNGFYSMGSYFATSASVPTNIKGEFRLNGSFSSYPTTQTEIQTNDLVKNRLNLGAAYNVQAGYLLKSDWALGLRYTRLNANAISANFAQYNRHYTFVATKYLSGNNLKVQTEVGYDELNNTLKTLTQKGNFYTQVMFTVQL
jgi:phosphate-selective porin OprO and OprP